MYWLVQNRHLAHHCSIWLLTAYYTYAINFCVLLLYLCKPYENLANKCISLAIRIFFSYKKKTREDDRTGEGLSNVESWIDLYIFIIKIFTCNFTYIVIVLKSSQTKISTLEQTDNFFRRNFTSVDHHHHR